MNIFREAKKMFKNKKLKSISGLAVVSTLAIALAIGAYAQSDTYFSGSLPANQGDTEISEVARASSNVNHFNIYLSYLGSGTTNVRAWGEVGSGTNVSNPYYQIPYDKQTWNVYYYKDQIPQLGTNVMLNLDNPVNMSSSVSVSGKWRPN